MPKYERIRAKLGPVGSDNPANIWLRIVESKRVYALTQEYPDLRPQAGWHLDAGFALFEVREVEDLLIHVEEVSRGEH